MAILTFAGSSAVSHALDAPPIIQVVAGLATSALLIAPLFLLRRYRADIATLWGFVRQARRPKRPVEVAANAGDES